MPLPRLLRRLLLLALLLLLARIAQAQSPLVTVEWLQARLGTADLLLIDARPARAYGLAHIPGAHNVDLFQVGPGIHVQPEELERRIRAWGVDGRRKIVIYDEGGGQTAPWLFYELYYHGVAPERLALLDGGLAKWQAAGAAVTQQVPAAPVAGDFRAAPREEVRVRLPEFLHGSGDPQRHAQVEALDARYHFGEAKFFDRAGHIPNAIMWPTPDFYNPDKTFKSADEIRRMAAHLGVRPGQQVYAHCGGGVAATVPFFALKFLAGFPQVKVFRESQIGWLQDERGLPMWTYDAPALMREVDYVNAWGGRMARMFGIAQLSVVDVRPRAAYDAGHLPFAAHLPLETLRQAVATPATLARALAEAGVPREHEAVVVSGSGGVTPDAALAFALLERIGQRKVSLMLDSVDEWAFKGGQLAREAGALRPLRYEPQLRTAPAGVYPRVWLAAGALRPDALPPGAKVVSLPYSALLTPQGRPQPAYQVWKQLEAAGVPRYAEIVCIADDPAHAAAAYFMLRLIGMPDVKLHLPAP